jgi:membrane fusion protein, copper/silver efflux system
MNKKNMIIVVICALIIVAGAWSYVYRSDLMIEAARLGLIKETASEMKANVPGSHQHGAVPDPAETGKAQGAASQAAEAPTIEIPQDRQQLIGVRTVKAAIQPLQRVIRTVGRVEFDEKNLATANTKIEGWIEKLYIDYTGRKVQKGEPLAEIYSPELVATQQEYLNILRWAEQGKAVNNERTAMMLLKDAQTLLEAAKKRLQLWDISDEQIAKIETSGKPIRTLTIYSPVSGYVTQKMAVQGMRVMPGEKLFDVVDLSSVWIVADIYEYELPLVKVGQTARIGLSYFPGKEFSSKVDYIYPALASDTRTAKVRFGIPNADGELKPQMFTNVEIKINMGSRLAVPSEAVIDTGVRQIVYVDKGDGYFEPREVSVGMKAEGLVEITAGLKKGDAVASSANFLIDSEAQLKGVTPLKRK